MLIFGIISVIVLAVLVVTKHLTSSRLQDKKQLIAETDVRKYRGDFKLAENTKSHDAC